MTVNTTVAFCDERIGVYIAKDLIPSKQHLDADESIDVEEWEVKDLLDLIYSGKMTDAKDDRGDPCMYAPEGRNPVRAGTGND